LPILLNFLSIPAQPGPASNLFDYPIFLAKKFGPFRNIANSVRERKLKCAKNKGKMKISLEDCGFSSQKR
jgi:hypothetical protein